MRQKVGGTTLELPSPDDDDRLTARYFEKYAITGNPFDIITEDDDRDEDVMDTNGVRQILCVKLKIYILIYKEIYF